MYLKDGANNNKETVNRLKRGRKEFGSHHTKGEICRKMETKSLLRLVAGRCKFAVG